MILEITKKTKRGFTFVEMMVSIGIITLLTVMILAYNRRAESITALSRSANKLVFELKRIQNQAMLVYQGVSLGTNICGWGMKFDNLKPTSVIVFTDYCLDNERRIGNKVFDENEKMEEIPLVRLTKIFESNINSVVFVPPESNVFFDSEGVSEGIIKIKLENQLADYPYYEIKISKTGQISKRLVLER